MKVEISNPKEIIVVEEQKKVFNSLNVNTMVDLPQEKKVMIFIDELPDPVTLWEGDSYDAIGEWTNADVISKLNELYSA